MVVDELKINVTIVGVGKSKLGIWLLKLIARIFHIKLEIKEE